MLVRLQSTLHGYVSTWCKALQPKYTVAYQKSLLNTNHRLDISDHNNNNYHSIASVMNLLHRGCAVNVLGGRERERERGWGRGGDCSVSIHHEAISMVSQ